MIYTAFLNSIFPVSYKDIFDILLVSVLLYQLYKILKGTVAVNIFIGISSIYIIGLIVEALEMKLLGTIIKQFIGVGGIALIVLFQQEIRKFLVVIGIKSWNSKQVQVIKKWLPFTKGKSGKKVEYTPLVSALINLSKSKTGALLVLVKSHDLSFYINTGDKLYARLSCRLIESIFCKDSPLHDGAVIIHEDSILAARCVLPVSDKDNFPPQYGMRHRAAVGISESTDAISFLVSEETGEIAFSKNGLLQTQLSVSDIQEILNKEFY